jgi:hypothetical protein
MSDNIRFTCELLCAGAYTHFNGTHPIDAGKLRKVAFYFGFGGPR